MSDAASSGNSLFDRARRALDARHDSPKRAHDDAAEVLRSDDRATAASVVALHAMALAVRELGDLDAAERHLNDALTLAGDLDRDDLRASVGTGLVGVLVARGSIGGALDLADSIRGSLDAHAAAELDVKCALAYQEMGRLADAESLYTQALSVVVDGPDRLLEARLRANRGTVLAYLGRHDQAASDLVAAERLAADSGHLLLAGGIAQNRGFASARAGNVVDALQAFDQADSLYARLDYPGRCAGLLASDRSEALMIAGLHDEAMVNAGRAVELLSAEDDVIDLAEARLLLARTQLTNGDPAASRRTALDATGEFLRAQRPAWALLSRYVALMAQSETTADDADVADRATRLAIALGEAGWTSEAASARIVGARAHLSAGRVDLATRLLELAAAARRRGTPDHRARAWHAEALLRLAQGRRSSAKRALTAGIKVVLTYQLDHASTELRIGASRHGVDLAELGLALALEDGRPSEVLRWGERLRSNALQRTMIPPVDAELNAALGELRRRESDLRSAIERGDPTDGLRTDVRRQEAHVSHVARTQRGAGADEGRSLRVDVLRRGLDTDILVEFVRSGGRTAALVATRRGIRLTQLGEVEGLAIALDQIRFGLTRLARDSPNPAGSSTVRAVRASIADTLARLDEAMIDPLDLPADGDLVIVPTGELYRVPWHALPSLRHRAVTITPSAEHWQHRASARATRLDDVTIVAGPDLAHSDDEATAIAAIYPSVTRLDPDRSDVADTLAALEGADLAHLICHGHLRSDSPMFSSLQLADGAMTIFDLQQLRRAPRRVVLPACNAGSVEDVTGAEVVGTAAALVGIGVESVVAPISVVNDRAGVDLMKRLHEQLCAGRDAPSAVASLRTSADDADDATFGWLTSLTCFG